MTSRAPLDASLAGCTIVVAADRRAGDLASALERRGARVHRAAPLSIVPLAGDEDLIRRTRELIADPPDIVVVTTGVGLRGWMDAALEHDLADDLERALRAARFIARGPKAHGAIQQAGFAADWVADSETVAEVGDYLLAGSVAGQRIAVQHHGAGADGLDESLATAGAEVVSLTVYRWGPPAEPELVERSAQEAAAGEVDAVLFTSAPGAAAWIRTAERLGQLDRIRTRATGGRLLLAAVGPVTAAPLRAADLRAVLAVRGRLGSLARCVFDYFGPGGGAPRLATAAGVLTLRSRGAVLDDEFIPLSRSGAALLGALFDAGGGVLSREAIAQALPRSGQNAHAVEMAVARVRDALNGIDLVRTVVKRGYRLAVDD